MADAVNTQVLQAGSVRKFIKFTNLSDGTGESAVVKVDASALAGRAAKNVSIESIFWSIKGMRVKVHFDADTDDTALILDGSGYWDFSEFAGIDNPKSTGYTGDIMFTTITAAANDSYTIILEVKWDNAKS
jgi:hypothetical protein